MTRVALDLSGIVVAIEGLSIELARQLHEDWPAFCTDPGGLPFLTLEIDEVVGVAPIAGQFLPKQMRSELRADGARFVMPEGEASVSASGHATVSLRSGLARHDYFTLLNMLRACLAWRLPSRMGGLLHAAGLVIDDRAFVLVGAEGAGKSSWARLAEEVGARVLSDDLVLIDGAGAQLELLGAPFRSTHQAEYRPGRWPLAAILFPLHGTPPALSPRPALLSRAALTANLTFIGDALGTDSRLTALLDRWIEAVPCADLRFGLESSFVALLRDWPR